MGRRQFNREDLITRALEEQTPRPITAQDVKKVLIKPAWDTYKAIMKNWSSFSEEVLKVKMSEETFTAPPSIQQIKLFLEWFARGSIGQVEEMVNDITVTHRYGVLKRAVKLHTNQQYSKMQNEEIVRHIDEMVKGGIVSSAARAKPVATKEVTEDVMAFLFASDEYKSMHPRIRNQLVWALILMTSIGLRPGEFIESACWMHSNDGLCYKDVDLVYRKYGNFVGWCIDVRVRLRKGHRDYKKHAPKFMFYEEPKKRHMCPVTWFLSFAFADNVFKNLHSYKDLQNVKSLPEGQEFTATYKLDWLDRPILRSQTDHKTISDTRIWIYKAFNEAIRGVGQRAGYREPLSAYCFRRGFASAVEGKGRAHARRVMLGHTNDDTGHYYLSGFVAIDSQSIIHDREEQTDVIKYASSMMAKRDVSAPMPHGALLTQRPPPRLPADQENTINMTGRTLSLSMEQERALLRKSRNRAFQNDRTAFFERGSVLPKQFEPLSQNSKQPDQGIVLSNLEPKPSGQNLGSLSKKTESLGPARRPSRYLQALLKYNRERKSIIDLLFSGDYPKNEKGIEIPLEQVLGPLVVLSRSGEMSYAYIGAEPSLENSCKNCGQDLAEWKPDRMHRHLLQCSQLNRTAASEVHMLSAFQSINRCVWSDCDYTFRGKTCKASSSHITAHLVEMKSHQCLWNDCRQIFMQAEDLAYHVSTDHRVPNDWNVMWSGHLKARHLDVMDEFCGLVQHIGVVIVAAHCIFCLGSDQPLSHRFQQFDDMQTLLEHMRRHIATSSLPKKCPHPLCHETFDSEPEFWRHVIDVHGVCVPALECRRRPSKRKEMHNGNEELPTVKKRTRLQRGVRRSSQKRCVVETAPYGHEEAWVKKNDCAYVD